MEYWQFIHFTFGLSFIAFINKTSCNSFFSPSLSHQSCTNKKNHINYVHQSGKILQLHGPIVPQFSFNIFIINMQFFSIYLTLPSTSFLCFFHNCHFLVHLFKKNCTEKLEQYSQVNHFLFGTMQYNIIKMSKIHSM